MKGRNPTADEKRHMTAVNSIGCIACLNMGYETPPDYTLIHHIDGKTKPKAHFKVLPLCDNHHSRYQKTGLHYNDNHHSRYQKTGLHYNLTRWELEHGTEDELLAQVESMLGA
jgi:hypothetical protein